MSAAHILVVDDEADIRGLLKEILSEEGYDVDVAGDAGQGHDDPAGIAHGHLVGAIPTVAAIGICHQFEPVTNRMARSHDMGILLLVAEGECTGKEIACGAPVEVIEAPETRAAKKGGIGGKILAVAVLDAKDEIVGGLHERLHGGQAGHVLKKLPPERGSACFV